MLYQFKIQIKEITNPAVWRQVLVPAEWTFYDLHIVIQAAFGWENVHRFMFSPKGYGSEPLITEFLGEDSYIENEEELDADDVLMSEVFNKKGQKFTYMYDLDDEWMHEIVLEQIIDETRMRAELIAGEGACPLENCGGLVRYEYIKLVLKDPEHKGYNEIIEWLDLEEGETWDPYTFNLEEAQEIVRGIE